MIDERPRALVVDDYSSVRLAMMENLKDLGFNAQGEGSSNDAVQAVKDFWPHLVLLDGEMPPGPNGVEVLEKLVGEELITTRDVLLSTGHIEPGHPMVLFFSGGMPASNAKGRETHAKLMAAILNGTLVGAIPKPIPNNMLFDDGLSHLARRITATERDPECRIVPADLKDISTLTREALRGTLGASSEHLKGFDDMVRATLAPHTRASSPLSTAMGAVSRPA